MRSMLTARDWQLCVADSGMQSKPAITYAASGKKLQSLLSERRLCRSTAEA